MAQSIFSLRLNGLAMGLGFWTDARIEMLRDGAERLLSNNQIANEINASLMPGERPATKNAIIGKRTRLNILFVKVVNLETRAESRRKAREQREAQPQRQISQAHRTALEGGAKLRRRFAAEAVGKQLDIPVEKFIPLRLTLVELKPSSCRFPIGDPRAEDFRFCGIPHATKGPYCPHHAALVHVPRVTGR